VSRRRRKKLPTELFTATIESLSHEGRGIAHLEGKTIFINGALPGEEVKFRYTSKRSRHDEGDAIEIINKSPLRITAECEYFGYCGGCSLQHMKADEQIKFKQSVLLEKLQHIGKVSPLHVLQPLTGPLWNYRQKARLGVRYVHKKERVLVGFREKNSPFLADMKSCKVLVSQVGDRLEQLSNVIRSLTSYREIAQIEVAIGDNDSALIFRNLVELTDEDQMKLIEFGKQYDFKIYLQPKGPSTVHLIWPKEAKLDYSIPEYEVTLDFLPSDFTQVNSKINASMIHHALELLKPNKNDSILELFCGLGNFSLPLGKKANHVTAIEGDDGLIERARLNANKNNLGNIEFHVANLMENIDHADWISKDYNKVLLDPPRSGAVEIIPFIGKLDIERIVYVSCNPATLARDAGILVNEYGFTLEKAGVMDMFPHTSHVESIALFTKGK